MQKRFHIPCLLAFVALLAALAFAAVEVPALKARVNDLAGVLSPEDAAAMEKFLADFEAKTSNQVAVLIVPSLQGENGEDYAIAVARKWGLGTKEHDNGVLLLVAVQDRVIRIEVGTGLQGALTDLQSSRIIRNEMAPLLQEGQEQWGTAVWAGVRAITQATVGEYKAPEEGPSNGTPVNFGAFAGIGFFVLGLLGRLLKVWISAIIGAIAGFFILGLPGIVLGAILGLLAPLFMSGRGGGLYMGGGGFGGGFSGGGGFGGGFSGGGGSFDGGGASGRF